MMRFWRQKGPKLGTKQAQNARKLFDFSDLLRSDPDWDWSEVSSQREYSCEPYVIFIEETNDAK